MENIFKTFYDQYNKNEFSKGELENDINQFEKDYSIRFPDDFRKFLLEFGNLWTPNILDLIVDNDSDLNDIQDFWKIERIRYDKAKEWTAQLEFDLIPIASDSMGNIIGYSTKEITYINQNSTLYFFDHDFDTIEPINKSFTEMLKSYLVLLD